MRLHEKLQAECRRRRWDVSNVRERFPDKSRQTIYNWWNGETVPDLRSALEIARLLEIPLDYLADDGLERPPHDLSDEERHILKMVRKLGADEAMARLLNAESPAPPARPPGRIETPGEIRETGPRAPAPRKGHAG